MKIITPTYKRAGEIKTINIFKDKLILACHKFESAEYKKAYPKNEIMILPDDLRGNMAKVRNYIKNNYDDELIVMVDDDIKEIGYHEKTKRIEIDREKIFNLILNGFQMAKEIGTVLFGINIQFDPRFYREFSPFSFLSVVLGPFSCHLKSNLQYDERLGLNEDYDFALQVLRKYHKILRFNKYYYICGHLEDAGGCGAYRLLKNEKEQAEIMIKKWGSNVVKYNFENSTNPLIHCPYKGI